MRYFYHHLLRAAVAASLAFRASRRAFSFAFSVSLYCFSFCLRSFFLLFKRLFILTFFLLTQFFATFIFALRSASACFNLFLRSCSSCFSRSAFAFRKALFFFLLFFQQFGTLFGFLLLQFFFSLLLCFEFALRASSLRAASSSASRLRIASISFNVSSFSFFRSLNSRDSILRKRILSSYQEPKVVRKPYLPEL